MKYTKEKAKKYFGRLSINEQKELITKIQRQKEFYLMNPFIRFQINPAQYISSVNKEAFENADPDFFSIDNEEEFGYACIYYLSKFVYGNRKHK